MGKKILFCASTQSHLQNFHAPYLAALAARGHEVWTLSDGEAPMEGVSHRVVAPFRKRFSSPRNLLAIWRVRRLLVREGFDLLSVHTTLAAAVVRAAVALLPKGRRPRVCSICHGYLFGEGDGLKKWAYLLPEKLCAPVTDLLLTMNREDEATGKRHQLAGEIAFIDGMGLDLQRYRPLPPAERRAGRMAMGYGEEAFLFLGVGEFSKRKNQALLIRAFAKALPQLPDARLLLAGKGALLEDCRLLVRQLGLGTRVVFLGHVREMERLYPLCDALVSASRIEGLPFNLLEALSCGLPVLVSDIKGHRELVRDRENGLLCGDEASFVAGFSAFVNGSRWRQRMHSDLTPYSLEVVKPQILGYYTRLLGEEAEG